MSYFDNLKKILYGHPRMSFRENSYLLSKKKENFVLLARGIQTPRVIGMSIHQLETDQSY